MKAFELKLFGKFHYRLVPTRVIRLRLHFMNVKSKNTELVRISN